MYKHDMTLFYTISLYDRSANLTLTKVCKLFTSMYSQIVSHLYLSSKVIYHPLYSMNKFVTNNSKLPQDGAQVFPYMG